MLNSLEKLRGGFCDVSCSSFIFLCSFVDVLHFVVVSSFVDVLQFVVVVLHSHFLFDVIPHPSVDYRPFLYFQPSPSQSDSRQFQFSTIPLSSCRALRSWVGIFCLQAFFTLRSFTHILTWIYQGFPGGWQFFLEVCRASYWSRNTDPAHLLVWFTVIQHLRIQNDSVLNSTIYWHELLDLSTPYLIRTLFACSKSYM